MSIHVSIGTSTADSYITVSDANTYFETRNLSTPWDNILSNSTGTLTATSRKEQLLKQATREIDYNNRFFSRKWHLGIIGASDYQVLEFPRWDTIDNSGNPYIPQEVKDATCEQALWVLERGNVKVTNEGQLIDRQIMSKEAQAWLGGLVNRRGVAYGVWSN